MDGYPPDFEFSQGDCSWRNLPLREMYTIQFTQQHLSVLYKTRGDAESSIDALVRMKGRGHEKAEEGGVGRLAYDTNNALS